MKGRTLGGIYSFTCPNSCPPFEAYSSGDTAECPHCKAQGTRKHTNDNRAYGSEFATPYLSRAMGVNPDQVAEAKREFPHHEFAPDGRMVFRSVAQYDRVRKDLGM